MKILRNVLIVCIASLLLFSVVSSTTHAGSGTHDGEIILNYSFERPAIKAALHDSPEIRVQGLPTHAPPGAPMMPFRTVRILISLMERKWTTSGSLRTVEDIWASF